jgi:hypothetical protein
MRLLDQSALEELFWALGEYLEAEGQRAAIIIVGGASLALRGTVDRATTDVDVLALVEGGHESGPIRSAAPLPPFLLDASRRVARDYGLPEDWLNAEVAGQWDLGPPPGLADGIEWQPYASLRVGFAGRTTLIALKLFAAVDQGRGSVHFQDLLALQPTVSELASAAAWVREQDASESFPGLVRELVEHVREALRSDS